MPDEPPPPPPVSDSPKSTGLPSNIAAALACIPLVGGIVFFILEKRDPFVRFYAMQSIFYGGAWLIFNFAAEILQRIFNSVALVAGILTFFWGNVFWPLINIAFLVIWIVAMVRAFTG